jgi:hypothetical protein
VVSEVTSDTLGAPEVTSGATKMDDSLLRNSSNLILINMSSCLTQGQLIVPNPFPFTRHYYIFNFKLRASGHDVQKKSQTIAMAPKFFKVNEDSIV